MDYKATLEELYNESVKANSEYTKANSELYEYVKSSWGKSIDQVYIDNIRAAEKKMKEALNNLYSYVSVNRNHGI